MTAPNYALLISPETRFQDVPYLHCAGGCGRYVGDDNGERPVRVWAPHLGYYVTVGWEHGPELCGRCREWLEGA